MTDIENQNQKYTLETLLSEHQETQQEYLWDDTPMGKELL